MNIAELFVRVRADVSDVNRRMRDIENSLGGVERSSKSATLSTGRLGNQFANLAGQIAHTHPIVGNLAGVLGNFAIGSAMTVGILAGVAAIAVAYDKITESSRKAREQTEKLVKGLVDQARALREASVAGAEFIQLQAEVELQSAKQASGIGVRSVLGAILTGKPGLDPADAAAASKRIADAETAVAQAIVNVKKAYEAAEPKVAKLKDTYMDLRDAAAQVNAEILKEKTDWWKSYIEKTHEALSVTQQLANAANSLRPSLIEALQSLQPSTAATMPGIAMPFEGLDTRQKDQLRALGVLTDKADENAKMIQSAVVSSANVIANTILSAVNVGGGGRGSQIGGALGGGLGAAWGSTLGWAGGPIGAVLGGIGGSLLGGLFDHPESRESIWQRQLDEQRAHTAWLRANNQLLGDIAGALLNAPSVYKVAQGRFDATDVKNLRRIVPRYNSRGGAVVTI